MDRIKHIIAKSRIITIITIGLTVFDMVSDILLAMDYAETGEDEWWFALTLTFFILPLLPLLILLFFTIVAMCKHGKEWFDYGDFEFYYPSWKQFECVAESGPQLILQLYIMTGTTYNTNQGSDHISSSENTTLLNTIKPENSTSLLWWIAQTDNATVTVLDRTTDSLEWDNNKKDTLTLILQVIVIISALFSLSWSATLFKAVTEAIANDDYGDDADFKITDFTIEVVWNMLCISSRVIALALFASMEKYWFAALVTAQATLATGIYVYENLSWKNSKKDFILELLFLIMLGTNSVFNIFLTKNRYMLYVLYWIFIMIENVILISIWYVATDGQELWFHDAAIVFVIVAYSVSFLLKTLQTRFDSKNTGKSISRWKCKIIHLSCSQASQVSWNLVNLATSYCYYEYPRF